MRVTGYDPFPVDRPEPEPVDGPLPPPIALVDEDDPAPRRRWRTWLAVGLLSFLALDAVLRVFTVITRPVPERAGDAPASPAGAPAR